MKSVGALHNNADAFGRICDNIYVVALTRHFASVFINESTSFSETDETSVAEYTFGRTRWLIRIFFHPLTFTNVSRTCDLPSLKGLAPFLNPFEQVRLWATQSLGGYIVFHISMLVGEVLQVLKPTLVTADLDTLILCAYTGAARFPPRNFYGYESYRLFAW